MTKSILAGAAFLAAAAIAMPVLTWPAGEAGAQTPPAAPAQPVPGQHHGWHHHRMARSPQQRCEARVARQAARVAFVGSLLNLTADQQPLFAKLQGAVQAATAKENQLCTALPAAAGQHAQRTILDRLGQREQFLQARLQAAQQVQPALQALYQALTPAQKAIIDHPLRRS